MKRLEIAVLIVIAALITPQLAGAVVTFDRLDDDLFIVSHRVKVKFWMGRGQAQRLVYEKAASVCVAAGYSHFKILHQESEANQHYVFDDDYGQTAANASVRVRFYNEDAEERIECDRNASEKYVEQAAAKLERGGYRQARNKR